MTLNEIVKIAKEFKRPNWGRNVYCYVSDIDFHLKISLAPDYEDDTHAYMQDLLADDWEPYVKDS